MNQSKECDSPLSRLQDWAAGRPRGPWYVTIYPTNRCNLKCATCWQRSIGKLDFSCEISEERLLRLVDECADLGAREWTIVGGGEPMMRAETVIRMCERIRSRGMNGNIQCNGTIFAREHFQRLIDIGWQELVFSLDGSSAEINDAIRSDGAFDKTTATIRSLTAIRRERGAEFPLIFLYNVLTNVNYKDFPQLVELANDLGCAGLRGVPFVPHDSNQDLALTPEQRQEVLPYLEQAAGRARELGLTEIYSWLLENIEPARVGIRPKGRSSTDPEFCNIACLEPWTSLLVVPDGKVGPCCVFWDEAAPSLKDHALEELWLGYVDRIRKGILEDRFPPYCAKCQPWLRTRTETLLAQFESERRPSREKTKEAPLAKALFLVRKAGSSIRRHGIREALKRGREWIQIQSR